MQTQRCAQMAAACARRSAMPLGWRRCRRLPLLPRPRHLQTLALCPNVPNQRRERRKQPFTSNGGKGSRVRCICLASQLCRPTQSRRDVLSRLQAAIERAQEPRMLSDGGLRVVGGVGSVPSVAWMPRGGARRAAGNRGRLASYSSLTVAQPRGAGSSSHVTPACSAPVPPYSLLVPVRRSCSSRPASQQ